MRRKQQQKWEVSRNHIMNSRNKSEYIINQVNVNRLNFSVKSKDHETEFFFLKAAISHFTKGISKKIRTER